MCCGLCSSCCTYFVNTKIFWNAATAKHVLIFSKHYLMIIPSVGCYSSVSLRNRVAAPCCSIYTKIFPWSKSTDIISHLGYVCELMCLIFEHSTSFFIAECLIGKLWTPIYILTGNHKNIFNDAKVPWSEYRYYDPKTVGLDFEGMIADIQVVFSNSFIFNTTICVFYFKLDEHCVA